MSPTARTRTAEVSAVLALVVLMRAGAEVERLTVSQPGVRNLGVWRLTNDPAIRDEANYHNIQCWSPNGRYTCHTHWAGAEGPGGKASAAEIHRRTLLRSRSSAPANANIGT